nr:O-antigen polymerase [Pseudomaricurvus sp. HS19]
MSPVFFTNILFLLVFYLPISFAEYLVEFLYYSDELKVMVVVCHVTAMMGLICANIWVFSRYRHSSGVTFLHLSVSEKESYVFFLVGVLGYLMLYLLRGVPALSHDVGMARQVFATGMGFFTWFFKGFMNFHVLNLLLLKKYKKGFLYFSFVVVFVALSGWRGNVIFLVLMSAVVLSMLRVVSVKALMLAGTVVLLIAFMGVMRSYVSGHAIYGIDISGGGAMEFFLATLSYLVVRLGVHVNVLQLIMDNVAGDYLMGRGILMDLSSFIPGASESVVYYLKDRFAVWEGGGGLPPTFLGGLYLDFGFWGAVSGAFILCFVYGVLVNSLTIRAGASIYLAFVVGFIQVAWFYSFLGTFFGYFPLYMLICMVIVMGIRWCTSFFNFSIRRVKIV